MLESLQTKSALYLGFSAFVAIKNGFCSLAVFGAHQVLPVWDVTLTHTEVFKFQGPLKNQRRIAEISGGWKGNRSYFQSCGNPL